MKKIITYLLSTFFVLMLFSFMLMWSVHNIWEFYSKNKSERNIWTYKFIAPKVPEFILWEPIKMVSKSSYWALWLIIWDDYLLCSSDYDLLTMNDTQMDKMIDIKKHRTLQTTFSERKETWEFWWKWDKNNDGILDWEWIFGWENTIDWKKFYKTNITWAWCYIRSYQTFFYNSIPKKQRFTSGPFNIVLQRTDESTQIK